MNIGYLLRTFPQISQTFVNHEIQGLQQKGTIFFWHPSTGRERGLTKVLSPFLKEPCIGLTSKNRW